MQRLIRFFPVWRRLVAGVAGTLAVALAAHAHAQAPRVSPPSWTTSWNTALQEIPRLAELPALYQAPAVAGRTVRQIIVPTLSGTTAQLRISNRHGTRPLAIMGVTLAHSAAGAAIVPGSASVVTFGGKREVVLSPGMEMDSDAIPFKVTRGAPIAVSLEAGSDDVMQAWHRIAGRVSYVSTVGRHAEDTSAAAFTVRFTQYAWITRLAVSSEHEHAGALVAIGDSITDGLRSTFGADRSWPSVLSRQLAAAGAKPAIAKPLGANHADANAAGPKPIAVLNAGISGNRLLSGSACYGDSLESRFEHDAASVPGAHTVVVLIGINDLNFSSMPVRRGLDCDSPHRVVSADDMIAGYRRIIAIAHRQGLLVLGGTITPATLPPEREGIRLKINEWIRDGRAFDGVVDFDKALRDPGHPNQLRPSFDSGDHVHPSDAGYAAMATTAAGVLPAARR
ncbi:MULTISPECIES: SGNH/GDSL hydrolase family protein [unclassified Achromobacter]|uniref:SGNH/GDSL hydrolase family protein n=1 Tax=unclassified Achromobacter TaxID=2626865 RepID=UPI000B516D15|nr:MULTISPECIES: SGNH/GDSL hydrolase family protein [unclassified Achromobacter]OWT73735.1 hypothetical protein CEY05_21855 [Achromobacter sp. HZ34]OWT79349.1 hypothetical protein CEY04_10125 [Achromobacter sp. HZ28]